VGSVAVGFCHGDVWLGADRFYRCLNETMGTRGLHMHPQIIEVSGSQLDANRNDGVAAFLALSATWLLMVDTDMTWTPLDVRKVIEAADEKDRPIVGGLCFAEKRASGLIWPTLMVWEMENGSVVGTKEMTDWPRGEICKVDATGAAFLLVHRRVFETMKERAGPDHPAPWFAVTYLPKARLGEDVTFCIRATQLGFPIYVHTGASIGHVKLRELNEAMFDAQQATQQATKPLLTLAK
jgi:hypothetical protein